MASILKVDKLDPQSGTALEIGTSGDTVTVPSGATLTTTDATLNLPTTITSTTEVKTNKVSPATGTAFALGDSGDTFTVPAGATINNLGTASGVWYDDDVVQSNIAMLGFKVAVNGSLVKYNLVDGTVDEYEDASGIDTGASTNATLAGGAYSGSGTTSNYFGSGADGALTTSGHVTHTVLNKNGAYDGDLLVKNYSSLTISSGNTMTVDQPCRGMCIFVTGDCTINGTLSMNLRGALADPTASGGSDSNAVAAAGLQFAYETSGGSSSFTNDGTGYNGAGNAIRTALANLGNTSSNGTTFTIARAGAAGGARKLDPGGGAANRGSNDGADGTTGQSGGGGSGGLYSNVAYSGAGTAGTCFSGGTGGGGGQDSVGTDGTANGGAGGAGGTSGGGGAGNPGGGGGTTAGDGTGGTLLLIVGGDLTIGSGALIQARGQAGAGGPESGGGSSGSGNVIVLYAGTLANSGSITAAGVEPDSAGRSDGGIGGDGSVQTAQVKAINVYTDMTLQSLDTTAETEADYTDIVMLMENDTGTATLNTDLKAYTSEDSGSTFTQGTLVDEGSWGTNKKIVAFHDSDISAQSGTAMCYKIETLNQGAAKITKIHATSMGWK